MERDFSYKKIFLLGFGFFGISLVWSVYNSFVPIFLRNFGLAFAVVGAIMTIDNIFAVTIQPYIGFLSDKTKTRLGRRRPYILVFSSYSGYYLSPHTGITRITPHVSRNRNHELGHGSPQNPNHSVNARHNSERVPKQG